MMDKDQWEGFRKQSVLREGILNWYPFREGCEILHICDGEGAIVGLLSRVAKQVTVVQSTLKGMAEMKARYCTLNNVQFFSTYEELREEKQFDYVILEKEMSTLTGVKRLIDEAQVYLKEQGRLLFVCNNRFGMKYWCGAPEKVSGLPFAGIRGEDGSDLITRQDLINVLQKHPSVKGWNIYYPFPDAILTQAIYTDEYLPKASARDRVIPYYTNYEKKTLVCTENDISDSLITNGVFHIFANSFLVECARCECRKEVIFAALSTDRGKEHGFVTAITANGTVQKRIIADEGRGSLTIIHQNKEELCSRGIKCVSEKLHKDYIEMPYIKEKTLIEQLKDAFHNAPQKVEKIFDDLYNNIISSSEWGTFEQCCLLDEELDEDNAGVILKKAYIDMIPYNCFYIENSLVFYDQEFVKENYPAKYILFRALRYTYIYIREAESIISLEYFKNKYELQSVWNTFERQEARFVEDNRNYDELALFYRMANVEREIIDDNIARLTGNSLSSQKFEKKIYSMDIYKKNKTLNDIKNVQKNLLEHFIDVCDKNNLSYCVFYGTLLGTVRHRGFVPWDDDIDVVMPRSDYNKLIAISEEAFVEPYFLQTPLNDEEFFCGGYCKLRDSNTSALQEKNKGHKCNQGIWIDVFPLDVVPQEQNVLEEFLDEIRIYQQIIENQTYADKQSSWRIDKMMNDFVGTMVPDLSREYLCGKLEEVFNRYSEENTGKVAIIARMYASKEDCIVYDAEEFEFVYKAPFEDLEVYIPCGYDNCLKKDYGDDYRMYPKEDERVCHHNAQFDVQTSYRCYIGLEGEHDGEI